MYYCGTLRCMRLRSSSGVDVSCDCVRGRHMLLSCCTVIHSTPCTLRAHLPVVRARLQVSYRPPHLAPAAVSRCCRISRFSPCSIARQQLQLVYSLGNTMQTAIQCNANCFDRSVYIAHVRSHGHAGPLTL